MADRRVTSTGKDIYRDITSLCGWWGRATKAEAIRDIEYGLHTYYVQDIFRQPQPADGPISANWKIALPNSSVPHPVAHHEQIHPNAHSRLAPSHAIASSPCTYTLLPTSS